jgi:hypothetical protein
MHVNSHGLAAALIIMANHGGLNQVASGCAI